MWGFAGFTPADRLGCAVRAALRDVGADQSARSALRDAAELIMSELELNKISGKMLPFTMNSLSSPEMFVRSGALGSRAAAALVSAMSPLSLEEQTSGAAQKC